jgi:hypothetical protein
MPIKSKFCVWVQSTAVALLLWLIVAGCSSITPYQPRNNREEGPERGIFTGSKGEFVISIPVPGEPAKEDEKAKTTSEETPKSE